MSKEKQIEEMAKVIDEYTEPLSARDIHKADFSEKFAETLYNAGYRKQIEGEWVKVITDDRVHWKCSACGKDTDLPNYEKADCCFNCGAHMRKEDEKNETN